MITCGVHIHNSAIKLGIDKTARIVINLNHAYKVRDCAALAISDNRNHYRRQHQLH